MMTPRVTPIYGLTGSRPRQVHAEATRRHRWLWRVSRADLSAPEPERRGTAPTAERAVWARPPRRGSRDQGEGADRSRSAGPQRVTPSKGPPFPNTRGSARGRVGRHRGSSLTARGGRGRPDHIIAGRGVLQASLADGRTGRGRRVIRPGPPAGGIIFGAAPSGAGTRTCRRCRR